MPRTGLFRIARPHAKHRFCQLLLIASTFSAVYTLFYILAHLGASVPITGKFISVEGATARDVLGRNAAVGTDVLISTVDNPRGSPWVRTALYGIFDSTGLLNDPHNYLMRSFLASITSTAHYKT